MIHLPFPPSVNALWRSVKGRAIKSKRYREWEKEAGWQIARLTNEHRLWEAFIPDDAPYHLDITLVRPDKRGRDVNNYDKAISDLLEAHGITPNDRMMQSIFVHWADAQDGPTVKVRAG